MTVNVSPVDGNMILTASNDHTARITDIRACSTNGASTSDAGAVTDPVVGRHGSVSHTLKPLLSPSISLIMTTASVLRLRHMYGLHARQVRAQRMRRIMRSLRCWRTPRL